MRDLGFTGVSTTPLCVPGIGSTSWLSGCLLHHHHVFVRRAQRFSVVLRDRVLQPLGVSDKRRRESVQG